MVSKFDAIVVGAGPSGCACAFTLAQGGLDVLLVERGKFAGAKNMWGGAFYGPILNTLFPQFHQEAPIERYVVNRRFSLLNKETCVSFDFRTDQINHPSYNSFTLSRAKFDQWFVSKVQKAGATVALGLKVDDLLLESNRIVGIKAGGSELQANVVVAADGVNSILADKAGIGYKLSPVHIKQGVKEVIKLSREQLEQRFNLSGDEGLAWEFLGNCTRGLPGGGFIYTNKESISVGIAVQLDALIKNKVDANDLLEEFKHHPVVKRLIDGGELVEYSAHLIPTGWGKMIPRLYTDGMLVVGDAAALVLGTGLILEGANYAIASGIAAATTIMNAKKLGDFSKKSLSLYLTKLKQGFVIKDLQTFQKAPHFLENTRVYDVYPELICTMAEKMFTSNGEPHIKTWELLKQTLDDKVSFCQILNDLFKAKEAI